jgi:hypothetical protein
MAKNLDQTLEDLYRELELVNAAIASVSEGANMAAAACGSHTPVGPDEDFTRPAEDQKQRAGG